MTPLDSLDRAILVALIADGRATYAELAAQVRLSPNAVADRVRRLRRDGVLAGFTAVVDEKALGKTLGVVSDLKLRDGVDRISFARSIEAIPQVIGARRLTGDYDYQLHLVCADPAELEAIVELLKRDYGVSTVNSRLILREVPTDKSKLVRSAR